MAIKIYNVNTSNIRVRENGVFTAPELITDAGLYISSEGGYYAGGNIVINDKEYVIIIAPKELGEYSTTLQWKTSQTATSGANSTYNGKTNMDAIVSNGISNHPAAEYCYNLDINGFNDWHLPSPDELELCYRYLKPNENSNNTSSRILHNSINGTNPNSNPVGIAYTSNDPSRTVVGNFQEGNSQAFESTNYWSSMEYNTNVYTSWNMNFYDGNQSNFGKTGLRKIRAVRWVEV